jgi:hypothetical protein
MVIYFNKNIESMAAHMGKNLKKNHKGGGPKFGKQMEVMSETCPFSGCSTQH